MSPEFGIDAKREELSILTGLPNPIASGLGVLHRPAIDPQDFSRPRVPDPAVPIKKSVKPDYVICLEDGKKLKCHGGNGLRNLMCGNSL